MLSPIRIRYRLIIAGRRRDEVDRGMCLRMVISVSLVLNFFEFWTGRAPRSFSSSYESTVAKFSAFLDNINYSFLGGLKFNAGFTYKDFAVKTVSSRKGNCDLLEVCILAGQKLTAPNDQVTGD